MKTGWKWSFVAHLAIVAVIAAQLALVGLIVTYMIPVVQHTHKTVGEPLHETLPGIVATTVNLVRLFYDTWWIWVGILVLAGAAFEKFYRGENKGMIRLGAGGGVAFGFMGLLWAVTFSSAVPLVMMVRGLQANAPETLVRLKATEAEAAYVQLTKAVVEQDWNGAGGAANRLRDSFSSLERQGASAPVLAALDRQDDLDRIRALLGRLEQQARAVRSASDQPDPTVIEALFAELKKSYEELVAKAGGWPSVNPPEKGGETDIPKEDNP